MLDLTIARKLGCFRVALLLTLAAGSTVRADIFRYKDGRVISGSVVGETQETVNDQPVTVWAVEIDQGVFVQVIESELERGGRERLAAERQLYAKNVRTMEQTAASHIAMAGECTKHGLTDLAAAHYLRVLDLDPDNGTARSASGFDRDSNGRWVKKDVVMGQQLGKVIHKGRWRFPESVAIEERKEAAKQAFANATKDLVRWHAAVLSGRRMDEALQGIQTIDNPVAIGKIADFLLDTRKPAPPNLRAVYVGLLSRFENYDAAAALARASMLDASPQIRNTCLDSLARFGREAAIPVFAGYLTSDDPELINRAAEGLGQLRAESAILPLIDALVTTHTREVGSGGMNASPTSGSFSMGGKQSVKLDSQNQSVLNALSQLTGQNYGFDESAWTAWYASVNAAPAIDLRRDW